ncbi:hypothetical protein BFAG_01362 [Bacteroides fragilis 3_1_12]|jgi:hypothetical protein|uniref:Uncharacterized protein n=1 Tax=Bacteroides fragilis 3_1_12 TaxID=457424 RepID=A0ABN0BIC8_BACFG|nr:hypothetical protein BFAG_01362 [Bacteroides fragilis 3_1_12]
MIGIAILNSDFLFSLFADVCSIFLILYRKNTIHYTNKKTLNQIIRVRKTVSLPKAGSHD